MPKNRVVAIHFEMHDYEDVLKASMLNKDTVSAFIRRAALSAAKETNNKTTEIFDPIGKKNFIDFLRRFTDDKPDR